MTIGLQLYSFLEHSINWERYDMEELTDVQDDLLFTNKLNYDIGKQVSLNNVLVSMYFDLGIATWKQTQDDYRASAHC